MLFLLTVAAAQLLLPTTALHTHARRDTDCGGITSGTTYTAGDKLFVVEADAIRSFNNIGGPIYDGTFVDCMTSCATTDGCTDLSYTSGGTCYLKQGAVNGILSIESGTCDAKIIPPPTPSAASSCAVSTPSPTLAAACSTATNAVVNGNFEEQRYGYLAPWIVSPGRSSDNTILKNVGAAAANDGSFVLSVQATQENSIQYMVQGINVCPGTTYRLSLAARRVSAAANALALYVSGTVDIGTKGYTVVMYSKNVNSDGWATFTADQDIYIPATETTSTYGVLSLQFANVAQVNTGLKEIWVDSIKLTPVGNGVRT
jgi:hypothetical protein